MRLLRPDPHMLAGAYALDAVEEAEREAFEHHLRKCRPCDSEVRGLSATATSLGMAVAAPAPPELKARVLAATAVTRQLPPLPAAEPARERETRRVPRQRTSTPWLPWLATGLAAACLVVAVVFGGVALSARHQLSQTQQQSRAIAAVLAAPDAHVASKETADGGTATIVLSRSEAKAVVTTRGLPALPSGKVYQLWFIGPKRILSAGLVPGSTGGRTAPVLASGLSAGDQLGMTVEPAGGSKQPTTKPIMVLPLPA